MINGKRLDETYLEDKYREDFSWVDRDNGWTLADDEVFLMGDNRDISTDSRTFGPLKINEIDHKIVLKLKDSKKR
ncbi:S26 family signal peptidase [Fenollaria timonensis]|uniref:S26 family signal peptidase n=1 Tax=Fenollaria timonensis TaxID=1723384 RepID=UPI0026EA96DE|nr:S26 family signal peptidase [Fenollaria timonensis]